MSNQKGGFLAERQKIDYHRNVSNILLISQDPETQRILQLRCELAGHKVSVQETVHAQDPIRKNPMPDVIIYDCTNNDILQRKQAQRLLRSFGKKRFTSSIVLPPRSRGTSREMLQKEWPADMIVRKPYELESFVESLEHLIKNGGKKKRVSVVIDRQTIPSGKTSTPKKSSSTRKDRHLPS